MHTVGDVDYYSEPYNISFPIGSTNASFDITIIDDGVLEDDEMFNISITSITNGHIVGTPAVATVTIIDTTSKLSFFVSLYSKNIYVFLSFNQDHNIWACAPAITTLSYVRIIQTCIYLHDKQNDKQNIKFS